MKRAIAIILLTVSMGPAWAAAAKKKSPPPAPARSGTRLDALVEAVKPLILSYKLESGSAYLQIDPTTWNAMNPSQQRQVCDSLAATDVWKSMGLVNAWLTVSSTQIGRIKPNWTGGFEFSPSLQSLK